MRSKLWEIIEKIRANANESLIKELEDEVRSYSIQDKQIYTLVDENTKDYVLLQGGDRAYYLLFSDKDLIPANSGTVVSCSINKIIIELMTKLDVYGLVINPFSQNQHVDTITFIKAAFGQTIKFDNVSKDWGKGIPEYTSNDIMSKEGQLLIAMRYLNQLCSEGNIKLWFFTNETDLCPNAIFKGDDGLAFVYVDVDSDINMPKLSIEKKKELLNRGKQFGFDCYYVSFGLYSLDQERRNKGLLLMGDDFGIVSDGIQEVKE